MTRIEQALENLLINSKGEINSRIKEVTFDIDVPGTNSKGSCYVLKSDANGNLRLKDLIEFIDEKIVEYAIPKKELDEAKQYLDETRSPSRIIRLRKKAKILFTDLEKTGEGGEILLYILVQEFLKIPQLISKMSLKTSGQMHYHGADGVHVNYDSESKALNLYWGESKMYADVNKGIAECFKSLSGFLTEPLSYKSVQERDLQLITSSLSENVNDEELENALVRYFNKDDDLSNNLVYKGVCFIGFDSEEYPNEDLSKTTEEIKKSIEENIESLYGKLSDNIKANKLQLKEIHVFLIPFPSVSEFREYFLAEIE